MKSNHSAPRSFGVTLLITLVFAVAALAGCVGPGFGDKAPTAALAVDGSERWTGERFVFNASQSSSPNGGIARWHFDFGDGDTFETQKSAEAENVTHAYRDGGVFNVTLTVTDEGSNRTGKGVATDVVVVTVHEESRIPTRVNSAFGAEVSGSDKSTGTFDVNMRASSYDANLTLSNVALAGGTSIVTLRILDTQGELHQEKEVSIAAGAQETVELDGPLADHGTLTLEIIVTSGSVSTHGMMRILYA